MAKKQVKVLDRLAGKRVLLQGKFGWEGESLKARAAAYGATVAKTLDAKLDYLVLPDATSGKAVRQKAQSLIAKGAAIQVLEADAFTKLVEATEEDLLALIRAGGKASADAFRAVRGGGYVSCVSGTKDRPHFSFAGENFDGLDLTAFDFDAIAFEKCSFVGAKLEATTFDVTRDCDFSRATGGGPEFKDAEGSRFVGVKFKGAGFEGSIENADFTDAELTKSTFHPWHVAGRRNRSQLPTFAGAVFRNAKLPNVEIEDVVLSQPDFSGADLTACELQDADLRGANLRGATLKDGVLFSCKLTDCDLEKADLRGANLAEADLTGSRFAGADLTGANLRGAKLDRADLKNAKGYDAGKVTAGSAGPSLRELNTVAQKAKRLSVTFQLEGPGSDNEAAVDGSSNWGYHARVPYGMSLNLWKAGGSGKQSFKDAMMLVANALGHRKVRYETVKTTSNKAPKGGNELRELALGAISEAFGQPLPDADALAAATKAYWGKENKKAAAQKQRQAEAREKQKKKEEAAKAKALAALKKEAGDVTDFDSFMKAIVVRTDKDKVKKATKMLKADRFQLFNDIADTHVLGVVKSQTDPDLVYACRVDSEGHYACCTQNLNICGGLRGSVCKHLLVLIIGLVKAGTLDPATIDGWVSKTHGTKPELNKETMGDIFIRYKGAEAGEVDWRPTETVPEDYYAL